MNLCDYGCGLEAIHQFKNGRWCCSRSTSSCNAVKTKSVAAWVKSWHDSGSSKRASDRFKGEKNPMYGRNHSDLARKRMREKAKNRVYTKEWCENISKAAKERFKDPKEREKCRTKEDKEIMAKRARELGKRNIGPKNGMYGKKPANWNPDREQVERNTVATKFINRCLRLPLTAKITDDELLEKQGYVKDSFISYIESLFYGSEDYGCMLWDKNGLGVSMWNLHHKIPVSWFIKFSINDVKIINSLNNIRPLWHYDHMREHKRLNKFTEEQQRFWVGLYVKSLELADD